MRIVIADDNPNIRMLFKELLTMSGYEIVAEADNGSDALACYFDWTPDLIILDNHMERMNGIDAARHILKRDSNAIIILFTANPDEVLHDALQLGVKAVVSKPFDNEKIIETIVNATTK
jgi:two-component system chemotaxis response regulator CheY